MIEDSELVRLVAVAITSKMAEQIGIAFEDDPTRSPSAMLIALEAIKTVRAYDAKRNGLNAAMDDLGL